MSEMIIAIASSARSHAAALYLQAELAERGHAVSLIAPHCISGPSKDRGATILYPQGEQAFGRINMLLGIADLLVLPLPADQDAACVVGMAHISGVPVAVVRRDPAQECCFSIRGCVSFWCRGVENLLEVIADWPDLHEEA